MTTHIVTFERNRASGMHRAICSCGWVTAGRLEECQRKAAAHDMWDPVEVAAPPRNDTAEIEGHQ